VSDQTAAYVTVSRPQAVTALLSVVQARRLVAVPQAYEIEACFSHTGKRVSRRAMGRRSQQERRTWALCPSPRPVSKPRHWKSTREKDETHEPTTSLVSPRPAHTRRSRQSASSCRSTAYNCVWTARRHSNVVRQSDVESQYRTRLLSLSSAP